MKLLGFLAAVALLGTHVMPCRAADQKFEFQKGDHLCLIGNALAERMQHHGWLETLLHSRFPDADLVIRNLGFSADELTVRQRVQGFSDQNIHMKSGGDSFDEQSRWLEHCKVDVVFVFYGFNESFAGAAGVEKFKQDIAAFIKRANEHKYNGKSAPRLVFFSPIAFEDLKNPNLPDGKEHNARLKLYSDAMAEAVKTGGAVFVDLFNPTMALYATAPKPLTINGVHLNESGDKAVAEVIDTALFGKRNVDYAALEKLRKAVLDKNGQWFARFRPTDDFNIFGGRSTLSYRNGDAKEPISNYDVLIREMEVLEVIADNRDKRLWAVARGGDMPINDDNTPPFIEVKTNKPGKKPDGSYDFLSGEDAIKQMTLGKNMKVNLFATEEKFPELANPVQMAFDAKGRLWVAAWPNYPHWHPKTPMNDKLLILEDTKGTGVADKCTVFADDLHDPTGFQFYNGGVIVAQAPDLVFLKDTKGDDKADYREIILHGLSSGDSHHTANSFVIDPGGGLYWGEGVFHQSQIESIYGPVRNQNACMWRYDLKTFKVERYVPFGFANPHGHVVDAWGQDFLHDGTGANPYHATLFSGHLDSPKQHPSPPALYKQRTRPCPGTEILTSRMFPDDFQGNLLVANVIGFQGILRYKFAPDGASFQCTEDEAIISSKDPNFRPAAIEMGPDGAIYFVDWQKPLIGHMQHHIRDPNRDQTHGRIYRITYEGGTPLKPAKIAGEPIENLLNLLKEPENRTRSRVRMELSARNGAEVIAATKKWAANLDKKDPNYEHHMMEALWLHQANDVVDMELLQRMLRSPDSNARAAATRVLCVERDLIKDPLYLLRAQAEDEHPLVRLEAIRACSFFNTSEAAEVALLSLKKPTDRFLTYTLTETMKQLEQFWGPALNKGDMIVKNNPAGAAYIMEKVHTADLMKMDHNEAVYAAVLARHDAPDATRLEALEGLAKLNNTSVLAELLGAMERAEHSGSPHAAHIVGDLARMLATRPGRELISEAPRIKTLAAKAQSIELRAAAYAAWITAEGNDENAYAVASTSIGGLTDYLEAVQYVADDRTRGALYPHVHALMFGVPDALAGEQKEKPAAGTTVGMQVAVYQFNPHSAALEAFKNRKPDVTAPATRITVELPQVKDREEVGMIFSGNLNVKTSGRYSFYLGSDDGSMLYLDGKVAINNDGLHGMEEKAADINLSVGQHAITISYFNNSGGYGLSAEWKGPGFERKPLAGDVTGGGGGNSVQDAAIRAVTHIPGHESEQFADFANLIGDPQRRAAALMGVRAVPKKFWTADKAPAIIDTILAYLTSLPATARTEPIAVDALNLGKELANLLPKDQSAALQARLQSLNVDIVVIRPIPHEMRFDLKRFAVVAGKPVEIIFENICVMPHNFVILAPGALEEVGHLAESMALEAQTKVPDSKQVLWHTNMLLPGQSERLSFTAPKEPGEYPYICSFPGHYMIMNGIMDVVTVKTAANAPEIVVAHASGPQRNFVKMWEVKDLEADLTQPLNGRSSKNGKQMFEAAGCVKCHVIQGQGGKIGPDLSEIAKKYKGKDLLKQIIEPSAIIDDKFRNWQIVTQDGKHITGMIVGDDKGATIELNTNPLGAGETTKVLAAEIKSKKPSPVSPMPTGLLVTLSKEEILDLLYYLESGGK